MASLLTEQLQPRQQKQRMFAGRLCGSVGEPNRKGGQNNSDLLSTGSPDSVPIEDFGDLFLREMRRQSR
jgi:hypothetical protein